MVVGRYESELECISYEMVWGRYDSELECILGNGVAGDSHQNP